MVSKSPRPRAKEKVCDLAIKKTLAYGAIFKYPMSFYQLSTYLVTKKKFDYDFFNKSLKRLVKKKHIKAKDGKYYLPGVRPVSWNSREKYTKKLLKDSQLGFTLLSTIPWIKMLTVTGATAKNNAVKNDDIDIFIVTEKNRLWITRSFVWAILKIIGKYAFSGERNKKFCCNLFVDETKMEWN